MSASRNPIRGQVVVAGVGFSPLGKNLGRSELDLTIESARKAIADAGMVADDIDGLSAFPDRVGGGVAAGPTLMSVQRALGLRNLNYWQAHSINGVGNLAHAVSAVYAIASGGADTVLCFRTVQARALSRQAKAEARTAALMWSEEAYTGPYGAVAGAPRWGLQARRYLHDTGQDETDLAAMVLNNRQMAQRNPRAVFHGRSLTLDDYLASDMISSPLRILDCDMPVDASVAIVFTTAERARDLPHPPVAIEAIAHTPGPDLETHLVDGLADATAFLGKELWRKTNLTPADVDIANVYDGISFQALMSLEDLGFVPRGSSGSAAKEGYFAADGTLPVCTDGGQLGAGRYHGLEKVAETALQVRGTAGGHQIPGVEVGLAGASGGSRATAMLLTRG
ncbi:thiolase family protein [Rhodococcus sp. WAY2]|uniref:thiolase family protein n=1 Tax=Rhodococcus sp. WAY2 TaxID=2663121 RepID=UPI00135A28A4|nr:thiolase family protein [Rhodococcus sp. WAY2]